MDSFAILVDGGFIRRRLGNKAEPMSASQVSELVRRIGEDPCVTGMRLHRVYFYDAAPFDGSKEKPLRGGKIDFQKEPTYARSRSLHQDLKTAPYVALRMGELLFRGWTVDNGKLRGSKERVEVSAEDLHPVFHQKAVDMRLGLDIAALTLKRLVRAIVLVAGDSDFVPAMKFARREGAQLFLVPLDAPVREGMREHADAVLNVPLDPPLIPISGKAESIRAEPAKVAAAKKGAASEGAAKAPLPDPSAD